jgi:TctA family transporter
MLIYRDKRNGCYHARVYFSATGFCGKVIVSEDFEYILIPNHDILSNLCPGCFTLPRIIEITNRIPPEQLVMPKLF